MKIQKRTLYPEAQIKPVSSPDAFHLPNHRRRLRRRDIRCDARLLKLDLYGIICCICLSSTVNALLKKPLIKSCIYDKKSTAAVLSAYKPAT